ncbi:DNA mismatch repair protein MutS [Prochlorococcus sp. MIT 1300]|uniref:DNA mismatch repair protein MutS n=1 Tax=Prochlorococcus sp. MIT 1300 TaxID=3096218 RepID=UPI002A755889|nr:DNA mismatch repair protein MutS [Prochlorococcus sp. MIT 1300]
MNFQTIKTTTAVSSAEDPWPLLRNSIFDRPRPLHLIVHGRPGGFVESCLMDLASSLRSRRGSSVVVEALTADSLPITSSKSAWLIPLFLLPGHHVRHDVPLIRDRLHHLGVKVNLLPFLGAWYSWNRLLLEFLTSKVCHGSVALIHHPIRQGLGDRYISSLKQFLKTQIIPFENWNSYDLLTKKQYYPIPLALAPNHMADSMNEFDGISSLLEIDFLYVSLANLLMALP